MPAVDLLGRCGRREHLVVGRDVAVQVVTAELVGDRLTVGVVDVEQHDPVTAADQLAGDLGAEAACPAGDQRDLAHRVQGEGGDPLAVLGGVAEGVLQPLRALEVEVAVVLPRVADAAVVLDHRAGRLARHVAGLGLRDGRGELPVGRLDVEGVGGVGGGVLRHRDAEVDVGQVVLDGLERPDRLAELHAGLVVLHGVGERLAGDAGEVGGGEDGGPVEQLLHDLGERALEPLARRRRRARRRPAATVRSSDVVRRDGAWRPGRPGRARPGRRRRGRRQPRRTRPARAGR